MAGVRARRGLGALLVLVAAVGCKVNVPTPAAPGRSAAPARPQASAPSQAPAAQASPSPVGLKAAPAVRLQAPPGEVARLAGTVSIDAGYMVAAGAGNVLSPNGGQIVAAGAGNLIGADGATLIGADGATIVAAGGGNIVAAGGLNLIGADGGSLIGADGGSLIGADGGTYRLARAFGLLQAAPSPLPVPELGDVLPAAAMRVGLIDLRDGKPLAVGVGADGEPAYAVWTDLAGRFELFVPASLRGYVRVVAEAPGPADDRLRYDTIVRADADPDDVDEDTARVGRFLRAAFTTRFEQLMTMTQAELTAELEADRPPTTSNNNYFESFGKPMLLFFGEMSRRRGFPLMDPAKRRVIAQTAADRLLAACDFTNVTTGDVERGYVPKDPNERALDAFRDAMKRIRTDVQPLLKRDGAASFALAVARASDTLKADGTATYAIKKPADVTSMIVQAYLANRRPGADIGPEADEARMKEVVAMLDRLGILSAEDRAGRLSAAGRAVIFHMLYVFKYQDNPDPAHVKYGPVGQAVIDYLWEVPTGVASDLGRPPKAEEAKIGDVPPASPAPSVSPPVSPVPSPESPAPSAGGDA